MPKNRPPASRPSDPSFEQQQETQVQQLLELAIVASDEAPAALQKLIRQYLLQQQDEVLQQALELAVATDDHAYALLKEQIEEAAGVAIFRRDAGEFEINAFVIPLLAHSTGGLRAEQNFHDQAAFTQLTASIQAQQLESPDAKAVLVSHAYHADELDRIRYSDLQQMVREAFGSMTGKKVVDAPAITRSLSGWPPSGFAPDDRAVELRYLLGFALKKTDDPFYRIPAGEAADVYFAARAARFEQWAQRAAPLVARCLAGDGAVAVHFLYQDLFYAAKEAGLAEYATLELMSAVRHGLATHGAAPDKVRAVIVPVAAGDASHVRIDLLAADGALLASADKPLPAAFDPDAEIDDVIDALRTLGITAWTVADGLHDEGRADGVR